MTLRERIAAGDRAALGEAFERYRPLARKMLAERRRTQSDFDDLVQDAFLLLTECARRCSPGTTIGGCVATAVLQAIRAFDCHSATSDQTNPSRRGSRRVELSEAAILGRRDPAALPDELLELKELAHLVSELVEQLPPRSRDLLLARERDLLEPVEIAARLWISPGTIPTRLCRARRQLEALATTAAA